MPPRTDTGPRLATLSSQKSEIRTHLFVLVGYFLLALLVTYPVATQFFSGVPGDLLADRDQNLWNIWWTKESLVRFTNPFHTDLLYYPYGAPLYYHTLALPLGLIGLIPQVLSGLPAAYNTVLLVAFTLSGYGMFRLFAFIQGPFPGTRTEEDESANRIRAFAAAFVAGIVFAFTPYTLDALKGQPEVLSLQWMPFFLEMWFRATRGTGQDATDKDFAGPKPIRARPRSLGVRPAAVLAGVFLALTAYTSLYYAVYLLVFLLTYIAYRLVLAARRGELQSDLRVIVQAGVVTGLVAFALGLPLLLGLAAYHNDPRLAVSADPEHRLAHSADLLSFFAPPHDHVIFGTWQDRPGVNEPPLHDYVGLGYVALALSIVGVVATRRRPGIYFWAGLGILALVLAMGPQLQIGRTRTGIPLPFAAVEWLPGMDAIAKPERFVVLARLCMGVLSGWGVIAILGGGVWGRPRSRASTYTPEFSWRGPSSRSLYLTGTAIILVGLLAELPIHPRYMQTLADLPFYRAYQSLAVRPPGGLMELPFATQQSETTGRRMLLQTVHDKPIMSGYLSRRYDSPIIDSCSPFWGFISPLDVPREGKEIASPLVVERPTDVLGFYNIRYLTLYTRTGIEDAPVSGEEMGAFQQIVSQVNAGTPFYSDDYMSLYDLPSFSTANSPVSFHIGDGWYNVEQGGAQPFRWMKESKATLCVFAPHAVTAPLTLEGTAFAKARHVTLSMGGKPLYEGDLPTSGAFAPINIGPVAWQPGVTQVTIEAQEPGTTPSSLDPVVKDDRTLTVGFRAVRMGSGTQK